MRAIESMMVLLCLGLGAAMAAEDLPLGLVDAVDNNMVRFHFLADHDVVSDDVVAIYGPGTVERHPLTKQVIREQRQLVAKAQVLHIAGDRLTARLVWAADEATIEAGYDVIPLPGEASPDAPPILAGAINPVTAEVQQTVTVDVPIVDPEGGDLAFVWHLDANTAYPGRLIGRTSGVPRIAWTAPARPVATTATVTAIDSRGQTLTATVSLEATALGEGWRQRTLVADGRFGRGGGRPLTWLVRGADGQWWGADERGTVFRIAAGWTGQQVQPFNDEADVERPVAMVPRDDELFLLDGDHRAVLVLARDGVLRRRFGTLDDPTDLVLAEDGTAFVADQGLQGIQVFEPDGTFRCRLGRAGEGSDAFLELTRLAIDPNGTVYALDRRQQLIQRFDRFHRRLPTWSVQSGEDNPPIDLAWHRRGLLVLTASGKILIFDDDGRANETMPPLAEARLIEDLDPPMGIATDAVGEVYVTYPDNAVVARYDREGRLTGVRGPELWELHAFVADVAGTIYGLDRSRRLVSKFDAGGWLQRRFGGELDEGGPFDDPGPMAVSPDRRWLCILDLDRICVIRYDLQRIDDRPLIFGQRGSNNGQFEEPIDLAVDGNGHTYVLDAESGQQRVVVFDANGGFKFNVGHYDRGRNPDELIEPERIAVTVDGDTIYVYDGDRYEVMKFTVDHQAERGDHAANTGGYGRELGQYYAPVALACDRQGLLYVLDRSRRDLQVIDFRGNNGVPLTRIDCREQLDISSLEGLALTPDGRPWIQADEALTGLRWTR